MASSKEFLQFILEQLCSLGDISYRPMMGEYGGKQRRSERNRLAGLYKRRFRFKADSKRKMGQSYNCP